MRFQKIYWKPVACLRCKLDLDGGLKALRRARIFSLLTRAVRCILKLNLGSGEWGIFL